MRTHLITLVATLGFTSFALAAAAATAPHAQIETTASRPIGRP